MRSLRTSFFPYLGLLLLASLLAACASPSPSPAANPTLPSGPPTSPAANLPDVPAEPSLAPPSPASPSPAQPTATLPPAEAPAPSPTASPDPAFTPSPTPDLSQMGRDSWLSLSPDGSWQAEAEVYFPALTGEETNIPQYYSRLVLRHASGSPAWTVVDEWRDGGLGATTPQVFYWSPLNEFVLIADSGTPDGCSVFAHTSRLRRVDLATGAIQLWASDLQGVLAINPAGDTLIVFEKSTPSLRLVDVNSSRQHIARAERQLSYTTLLGDWQAGGARWDPSGKIMAFAAYPATCPPETTYIYTLDPLSGEIEMILDGASGWLDIMNWSSHGLVLGDRGGSRWLLDPQADTLTTYPAP